ncbi:MAG: hypothetical protein WDO13_00080 [Verrucomicrobiota bacterium]
MRSAAYRRRCASGVVLVVALAALAIMMVLLLALFSGASLQTLGAQDDATAARERAAGRLRRRPHHRADPAGLVAARPGVDFAARPGAHLRGDRRAYAPPRATSSTPRRAWRA